MENQILTDLERYSVGAGGGVRGRQGPRVNLGHVQRSQGDHRAAQRPSSRFDFQPYQVREGGREERWGVLDIGGAEFNGLGKDG